jgi:hypothetical protein
MNGHLCLQPILAVLLAGSLICTAATTLAFEGGGTVDPSQWMGGNSWYGHAGQYGSVGQVPYGSITPGGYVPPAPYVGTPVPAQDQASRIRYLERRIGELEADRRRQEMLQPPLRAFDSAYGPHAP